MVALARSFLARSRSSKRTALATEQEIIRRAPRGGAPILVRRFLAKRAASRISLFSAPSIAASAPADRCPSVRSACPAPPRIPPSHKQSGVPPDLQEADGVWDRKPPAPAHGPKSLHHPISQDPQ
eukprot:7811100-Pyramimonas_sp.AAC.1